MMMLMVSFQQATRSVSSSSIHMHQLCTTRNGCVLTVPPNVLLVKRDTLTQRYSSQILNAMLQQMQIFNGTESSLYLH